jgi:hypothetical protein
MAAIKRDPAFPDRWFISGTDKPRPEIGATLSSETKPELVVYWSGNVGRDNLLQIMREAGTSLDKKTLTGKLFVYGADFRDVIPLSNSEILNPSENQSKFPSFDACRAELTASNGSVVVWANVTGEKRSLDDGGENIGVNLSPELFNGPVRPVISHAIERTMHLSADAVMELLNQISVSIIPQRRVLG